MNSIIKFSVVFLLLNTVFAFGQSNDSINLKKEQKRSGAPTFSVKLSDSLRESSSLVYYSNSLWTHNDDTDLNLYQLDTTGNIKKKFPLSKVKNKDWEEISADENYFYIGDFGNNYKGNRTDLHILRVEKESLFNNNAKIDTISFTYSNQLNLEKLEANKTDFDCEAMIVSKDSIFLFTKQWKSKQTSVYSLPKTAGNYIAKYKETFDVDGLITGATFLENKKLIVLCGYSPLLKPFVYLLFDYKNNDFFSGKTQKVKIKLPFYQVEGIATKDGLTYYLTNEAFVKQPFVNHLQSFHSIDLSPFLETYLKN
jgi:hypothetical protein